jgi:hypothetical protein
VIGDVPGERDAALESRWYYFPAAAPLLLLPAPLLILVGVGTRLADLGAIVGLAGIIAALLTFGTFCVEARAIASSELPWRPRWWAYAAASLVASPVLVGVVYITQRWRHVGLGKTVRR